MRRQRFQKMLGKMNTQVFLAILLLATLVTLVLLILRTAWRSTLGAAADQTRERMEDLLAARTDFVASHTAYSRSSRSLLSVDDENLKVTQYVMQGDQTLIRTLKVTSAMGLKLLIDEQAVVSGIDSGVGAESAAPGIGNSVVHTNVRSIALLFSLSDTQTPVFVHEFLSSPGHAKFDSESVYVYEAISDSIRMKAVLDVLICRARLP